MIKVKKNFLSRKNTFCVSVIVPYYKKKKFIKKTLLSIINQSYQNLEILIVFDDERNSDLNYIKKLSKLDKRIKLIINPSNIGAGLSRNKALNSCKGDYVAFIDADDIWDKQKVKKQICEMISYNQNISHTSYYIINKYNKIIGKRRAKIINNFNSLLKSCDIGLSTVMIKKKILTKNYKFAKLKTKEDFILWLRLLKKGYSFYPIDLNLTKWRKLDQSLSSSNFQKIKDGFSVYYRYMNFNLFKSIYLIFILSINSIIKKL